jgi:hypothetical protein
LAAWAQAHLPKGAGVVTDRFTGEVIFGDTDLRIASVNQYVVNGLYSEGSDPIPEVRNTLRQGNFEYFILDKRIEYLSPQTTFFNGYIGPISIVASRLKKLGSNNFSHLIYQTQHYAIYRLYP